jgi:hypothetical protein
MHRAPWIVPSVAAVSLFIVCGVSAQTQAPAPPPPSPADREPARPAPVPTRPPGPGTPLPAPPDKEKAEEPETPPAERAPERPRVPEELLYSRTPSFVGPDLFNPPAQQGWISIAPSLTLSAEYNDNVFFSERSRRSDVILSATPGVTLSMQKPSYRLLAGYNISGQIFLDNNELNDFGKEQQLFVDYYYQISPTLTFTLDDRFLYSRGTNELTSGGTSVGFTESWRNTLTPGLRWQVTPSTGVGLSGSYTTIRFPQSDSGNSDTYRVDLGLDHRLTQRLTGNIGIGAAYIDSEDDPPIWTYTPYLGGSYVITPTLTVSATAGPTLSLRRGELRVTPFARAALTKTFKYGTALLAYDRAVTAETVGVSDRQAIYGSVDFLTLLRELRLGVTGRYSTVDTDVSRSSTSQDSLTTLTMTLQATYQLARGFSLIGAYTFYKQTTERTAGRDEDIDQNRVFFGVQYAYPITIY